MKLYKFVIFKKVGGAWEQMEEYSLAEKNKAIRRKIVLRRDYPTDEFKLSKLSA